MTPCVSRPVGWSSLRTMETLAPGTTCWIVGTGPFGRWWFDWGGRKELYEGRLSCCRGGRGWRLRGRCIVGGGNGCKAVFLVERKKMVMVG